MKLIQILPNVYGVKVPKNSKNFDVNNNKVSFFGSLQVGLSQGLSFDIPNGNWRILGFLTKDEISFDASEVVEKNQYGHDGYLDYSISNEVTKFNWYNPEQSFRSALPEDIYFENPSSEPNINDFTTFDEDETEYFNHELFNKAIDNYQTTKENITEKLLILQKL